MSTLNPKPDMFGLLEDLPVRRYLQMLQNRVSRIKDNIWRSAYFDQYAGKSVPYNFCCHYGPIPLQTPRRVGTTGFLGLAPLITPSTALLPRNGPLLTGRDGVFKWHAWNAVGFLSWTRTAQTGGVFPNGPVDSRAPGDIFSPVVDANGGAQVFQNLLDISWRTPDAPSLYFEVDLYDKKQGRSITGGRVPAEAFWSGSMPPNEWSEAMTWGPDTEIEPRLYVNQARVATGTLLPGGGNVAGMALSDTDDALFNQQRAVFYVALTFHGELQLEERPND